MTEYPIPALPLTGMAARLIKSENHKHQIPNGKQYPISKKTMSKHGAIERIFQ
jgi:hypothetical protein